MIVFSVRLLGDAQGLISLPHRTRTTLCTALLEMHTTNLDPRAAAAVGLRFLSHFALELSGRACR
jgi:hypothetical protein